MTHETDHLHQPVSAVARKDVATLRQDFTVQQALDAIRQRGVGEKIVYFYVVDADDRLTGVLPTRRLLTAPLGQGLSDLMITRVLAFFLTMVLGLAESVSIQSMTVTIQALRATQPTFGWYVRAFRREAGTSALLGTACGTVVGLIVWLWRGAGFAGFAIGASILL